MDAKLLTEANWKNTCTKFKVKDNGLQRALATYEKLPEDKYDDRLKGIASVSKCAGDLKKAKEVGALPVVVKYLADVVSAAESERRDITNAKAQAEKSRVTGVKADAAAAAAEQKAAEAAKKQEALDQQQAAPADDKQAADLARLKLGKPLLVGLQRVLSGGGKVFQWISTVKDPKARTPFPGLLVAPMVGPQHKQILKDVTGGQRFVTGTCLLEKGKLTFVVHGASASPAFLGQLRKSIQYFTKKTIPLRARGDKDPSVVEDDPADVAADAAAGVETIQAEPETPGAEQDQPKTGEPPLTGVRGFEISASVGRGGKNKPADVEAVQAALNRRSDAGLPLDGKCGAATIAAIMEFQKKLGQSKPDGLVEFGRGTARALAGSGKIGPAPAPPKPIAPPKLPKPALDTAPQVWHGMRNVLDTNIRELKKAISAEYANEHPDVLAAIDKNVTKLDVVLQKLDTRLADSLDRAKGAADAAARKTELQNSKKILTEYIKYVKAEPLIDHIDSNPFGVDTKLEKVITDHLTHMAKSIGV